MADDSLVFDHMPELPASPKLPEYFPDLVTSVAGMTAGGSMMAFALPAFVIGLIGIGLFGGYTYYKNRCNL